MQHIQKVGTNRTKGGLYNKIKKEGPNGAAVVCSTQAFRMKRGALWNANRARRTSSRGPHVVTKFAVQIMVVIPTTK